MRNQLLTILFLIFTVISFGQNIKTETKEVELTSSGLNDGRLVFSFCTNDINIDFNDRLEYYWFNEYSRIKSTKGGSGGKLLHGKYQRFNKNGDLTIERNYYLGLEDGPQKEWNQEGDIIAIYKYNKGNLYYQKTKNDEEDTYVEWQGFPMVKGSVKKTYSRTGNLQQTLDILDPLKFKLTEYYINGQLKKEYTYSPFLNEMYDDYIEYYDNGNIKIKGQLEFNSRVGEWKWFNKKGILDGTELYRIHVTNYLGGTIKNKGGEFYDSENDVWIKNGQWKFYDKNGSLNGIKYYKYGEEIDMPKY